MNNSAKILMHQDGTGETLLLEALERFPGLIVLCEITNEDANAQFLVLCSINRVRVSGHGEARMPKESQEGTNEPFRIM